MKVKSKNILNSKNLYKLSFENVVLVVKWKLIKN